MASSKNQDVPITEPEWKNLTRADLERAYVTRLSKRFPTKPDISVVEIDGYRAVHKDIKGKSGLVKHTLGSWLINREYRIYRRLSGCSGVPRLHSRPDRWSILIEYVKGERLKRGDPRLRDPVFFNRLRTLVDSIHTKGVVHLDLRHKGNMMITDGGKPCVIDFNSSFYLGGNALGRRLLPWFRRIDSFGLLKLKQRVAPDLLSNDERSRLKWFRVLRRLWIFS
jgi:hypothetical protein